MRWTDDEKAALARLKGEGLTNQEIADKMGRTERSVHTMWMRVKDVCVDASDGKVYEKPEVSEVCDKDTLHVTTKSLGIQTLDQLVETAHVDLDVWAVKRWEATSWEVTLVDRKTDQPRTFTNFRVFASFVRREPEPLQKAIDNLVKRVAVITPSKVLKRFPAGDYAQEICPFDVHMGKLAWGEETGQGNMDLGLASKWFTETIIKNLQYGASFSPSKIYFILGQDLLHYENTDGKTPIGDHQLDTDSRLQKVLDVTLESCYKAILTCAEVAPTEVVWIPGNHDVHGSLFLSYIVQERFREHTWITVDNAPAARKARLWGNLLVAWTHDASGRKEKVTVNMLPQFWPKLWGKSKYREWHTGHKHKANEVKYSPTMSAGGVVIKQLAALSKIDNWHYQQGFVDAVPACSSFIWTKGAGVCAEFSVKL